MTIRLEQLAHNTIPIESSLISFIAIAYVVHGLIGAVANLFVLYSIFKDGLSKPSTLLVMNLTLADFLFSVAIFVTAAIETHVK